MTSVLTPRRTHARRVLIFLPFNVENSQVKQVDQYQDQSVSGQELTAEEEAYKDEL